MADAVLAWLSTCLQHSTYGPADASTTPSSLALLKSRVVYLSGAGYPCCRG